ASFPLLSVIFFSPLLLSLSFFFFFLASSACSPSLSLSQVCPFHRHHFERLPPLFRRRRRHGASVEPPRRESLQRPCRLPRDPQPRRSDLHRHHLLLRPLRPIWNNPAISGKILQASMRFSLSLSLSSSLSSPSSYTLLEVFLLAW
ncbi:hypothetical protein ACMD2_20000, partial [Ananas comosus]